MAEPKKEAVKESVKFQTLEILAKDGKTLTILEGRALDEKEPVKVCIVGNITAVSSWLLPRVETIEQTEAHILVDREAGSIELVFMETDPYFRGSVEAYLARTSELVGWRINSGNTWEPEVLAEYIKMNRTCFASKEEAMKLHYQIRHFRAKVNKEIERNDDGRGNTKSLKEQAVETNLPETFTLEIPVFKGEDKMTIPVELSINPVTLDVQLISPELKDYIKTETDRLIDREIDLIKDIASDIAIIEK